MAMTKEQIKEIMEASAILGKAGAKVYEEALEKSKSTKVAMEVTKAWLYVVMKDDKPTFFLIAGFDVSREGCLRHGQRESDRDPGIL